MSPKRAAILLGILAAVLAPPAFALEPLAPDDPALKARLELWLRADAVLVQDGEAVNLWPDRSGHGRDLAASAGARDGGIGKPARLVGGGGARAAVRFAGETGLASSPDNAVAVLGDAAFTLVLVGSVRRDPAEQQSVLLAFGSLTAQGDPGLPLGAGIAVSSIGGGKLDLAGGFGHDATLGPGSFAPLWDETHILTIVKRPGPMAATTEFFIDGAPAGDSQRSGAVSGSSALPDIRPHPSAGVTMGRTFPWTRGFAGDVLEVLVIRGALDPEHRSRLEVHLSRRHGVPLEADRHPTGTLGGTPPAAGAVHWAFAPIHSAPPPPDASGWAQSPIDAFIAAKHREVGLEPVAAAERNTLVRRLHFDLTGLPPAAEVVAETLADSAPDALERLIDRLLASPRYGERWGRHWLDVARYADTAGDNADYPIPEAHLYRDYVIDAFNADKPYDELVREQVAGDILAREGPRERFAERVVATGFLALSRRYATAPYELWHLSLEDAIDTTGQAFLGLSLRCARCHDHKFDPISMRDYYALYGIFESTEFPWAGGEELASKALPRQRFAPLVPDAEAAPILAAHAKRLAEITARIESLKISAVEGERTEAERLGAELRALERWGRPPELPAAYAVREGAPRHTPVQLRGEPERPGPVVPRGAIAAILDGDRLAIPPGESGRRQLAAWLTRPDHPLVARVMANRVWQRLFARGIVATPSSFGRRGAAPTHPKLLDHLAARFVADGWSVKRLHRLILTSRTWQLASAHDAANAAKDPANDLLWRHDRRRLDAEAIRDAMMHVSGRLDFGRPGSHPFPPVSTWGWTQHSQFKAVYASRHRSVYLMTQRLQRHPFLALFDGADPNTTTEKRSSSTVPLQALYLTNSDDAAGEAMAFAERLARLQPNLAERIRAAYELAFGREPSDDEVARGAEYVERYAERLARTGSKAEEHALEPWTSYARVLLASNEFSYAD